ncbi:hypothetical protein [Tsukamurella sp. NPDC003166]|uniref:hypothetical protein n=1 Tax=Tsukamurella sp. NPDC003166 TaxID=3154444 RepID=UPI0033B249F0
MNVSHGDCAPGTTSASARRTAAALCRPGWSRMYARISATVVAAIPNSFGRMHCSIAAIA